MTVQPKSGQRGAIDKPPARVALERPHQREHERSAEQRMGKGIMPKSLPGLLRWYATGWDEEVPTALHRSEVWRASKQDQDKRGACRCDHMGDADQPLHLGVCCHLVDGKPMHTRGGYEAIPRGPAGSALGTKADTDPFQRYLHNAAQETDEDAYYRRPMHAALYRIGKDHPLMARALFGLAQCGYDWRGLGTRGHWPVEMFEVYIEEALRRLWIEYADREVRLQ